MSILQDREGARWHLRQRVLGNVLVWRHLIALELGELVWEELVDNLIYFLLMELLEYLVAICRIGLLVSS